MNNSRAIVLMVVAMGCFATVDAFVKLASQTVGPGQTVAVTSALTFLIFYLILRRSGGRMWSRLALRPSVLLRSLGDVGGAVPIVLALSTAPLSSVVAVMQAQPLVVTAWAALFLDETVGWRRWIAVAVGFVGVMMVVRPGVGALDPGLLWALLALVGFSVRDLASRALPKPVTTEFAVAWSMMPMTAVGVLMMLSASGWEPVPFWGWVWLIGISVFVSIALWALTSSMRVGEVSAVAPFRYSRIVLAMLIAIVVFRERPDFLTWIGVALIVGSGVYTYFRESQVAVRVPKE